MRVFLTFDDGPSKWTPQILDLLKGNKAKASFFVLGCNIRNNEKILRRVVSEGHTIGVHGWSHRRFSEMTEPMMKLELAMTASDIRRATDYTPRFWRAPHLDRNERVVQLAEKQGLTHVGVSVDPGDWALADSKQIASLVCSEICHNGIVDLHDGVPPNGGNGTKSRAATVEAVKILLRKPWDFMSLDQVYP